MEKFRETVRNFYISFYNRNDKAHGIEHADQVLDLAIKLSIEYGLNVNIKELIIAVYNHDAFCWLDRTHHHIIAFKYIMEKTKLNEEFENTPEFIMNLNHNSSLNIAHAGLEHRASNQCVSYFSELSMVLNAADRGIPNLADILERSILFNISKYSKGSNCNDENIIINNAINHILDKYGRNGYATKNYNNLYKDYYKDELEFMFIMIENKLDYELGYNIYKRIIEKDN